MQIKQKSDTESFWQVFYSSKPNAADDMKKIKGMGVELDNDLVIKWLFLPKLFST